LTTWPAMACETVPEPIIPNFMVLFLRGHRGVSARPRADREASAAMKAADRPAREGTKGRGSAMWTSQQAEQRMLNRPSLEKAPPS
jgi:hypothetical protein